MPITLISPLAQIVKDDDDMNEKAGDQRASQLMSAAPDEFTLQDHEDYLVAMHIEDFEGSATN
ncbi:hypothetical protein KIN20_016167 [Parelaphostrongylus tenuis]|uniref:Uncharacterized protein n=1 Tax=Parelaphostrongylus tenuis TaxID=148309 RepID=A0AAD5MG16_PARTN|nr:hypothetical protein KIN20_016167 [Parelaphostrongylus tenuis]